MAKYDLEMLLADVETVLSTHLNTKIDEINAEKNDSMALKQIPVGAYVMQSLNNKVMNYNPFILYGLEDISTEGQGPNTLDIYTLSVIVMLVDSGTDANIIKRMYRYSRALKETFQEHWNENRHGVKLRILSGVPASFKEANSSQNYRVVGVFIEAALA